MASSTDAPSIPHELQTLESDLRAVVDARPPASASRVSAVTKHALRFAAHHSKPVAWLVAQFIRRSPPEHKVSGLYFVDSICRGSITEAKRKGRDYVPDGRDPYVSRFEALLPPLTSELQRCPDRDKVQISHWLSPVTQR
jgi:hypothetical protein